MNSPDSATAALSAYASRIACEQLPAAVVHAAKRAILDSMGCSIGGRRTEPGKLLLAFVEEFGGSGRGLALATGRTHAAPSAAYLNGALANCLDFDDTLADGHLGSTIVPGAVSVLGERAATGRDLIAAVVAGYEVSARIGRAIRPTPERFRLVRGLGTFQTFGAAAAAGRVLGLAPDAMTSAFGIAGANAPIPSVYKEGFDERPVAWVKNNFGWATQGGVVGALLAARGFRGHRAFLDGDRGFWRMAGSDQCDFATMTERLGEIFYITRNSFKPYSCCRYHHTILDAVHRIAREHGIRALDVDTVLVRSIWRVSEHLSRTPQDLIDAQYSMPYQVASHLLGRAGRFDWMLNTSLADPEILRLAAHVQYVQDDDLERQFQREGRAGAAVAIRARSTEHAAEVTHPWGSPEHPISDGDLEQKFLHLTGPALGEAVARALADVVWNLESVPDAQAAVREAYHRPAG